jgi:hypothetical protein
MSQNIFEDIKQIYSAINESSHLETDMKKRRENNEKAIEDMKKTQANKDMVKAARKAMGVDEAAKPDYLDFDKDGNKKESMKKALKDKEEVKEGKKPNDGDLANNYPPYDKVTRGDVIAGRLGKDQMGGKKKVTKEGFSNWRGELFEVADEMEKETNSKEIKEKKVSNKIKINPDLEESIGEIGGTLLEMVEIDELDFIIESVYNELLEEGYGEDDIEEALEYGLTEAKVTMGHDTPSTEKKKEGLLSAARKKLAGVKTAAKAAVARGARKVAKGALGVARKMEGGKESPKTVERKPSTYRGAGAGTKEKVSSGSYTPPTKKKAEPASDPWEGSYKKSSEIKSAPKAKAKKAATPKTKTTVSSKKKKSNLDSLLDKIRNEQIELDEKALSRAQQRFMGMVYAAKKGETPASPEVAKAASGISKKEAKKFAKTKHEGLPEKVGEEVQDPKAQQVQKQQLALDRKKLQLKMQQVSKKQPSPSTELIAHESVQIEEGMTMKDFKQQRSRQKQKEKRAAEKTSPLRRAGIHDDKASPERDARHRANVDPDFDGDDSVNYPGGKLKNPKKIRKAKAIGELTKEEIVTELNRYERETGKDYKTGKEVKTGGAKDDIAYTTVKKSIRKMEGIPAGQRKKVPGKKPPTAGSYGAPASPAQKVAKLRAMRQQAQSNMSSRFD